MSTRVADLLRHKGGKVVAIEPSATVYDAIARMVNENVGSILVLDGDEVQGIFTERDYLRRIILQGRASKTTRLSDVMTKELIVAEADFSVEECLATMTERKCRHMPVVDRDGRLQGVISMGDCVKEVAGDAQARVQHLTAYIKGAYPA